MSTGSFVLDVAEARARARDGYEATITADGDSVVLTYVDGAYVVEAGSLFSDGPALQERVQRLLARHG